MSEEQRKEWEELLPHSKVFLRGIHPGSPPPPPQQSPILKLLAALKREQQERFKPAPKLGEK